MNTTVPSPALVSVVVVTVCVSPSTSKSFVNTFPETGVSTKVALISATALVVLGVVSGFTVTVTVAVSQLGVGVAVSQSV